MLYLINHTRQEFICLGDNTRVNFIFVFHEPFEWLITDFILLCTTFDTIPAYYTDLQDIISDGSD